MRAIIVSVLIVVVFFPIGLCQAAGFKSGDVVIVSLPVGDNLYVAGGKVVVSEPVSGDLVAAGGTLILNGPVGADLQIVGGSLIVNSPVRDDVRAAGGEMVFSSSIGGDLVVLGGDVTIPAGAVVEGDAVIASGSLHLGGTVRGNLLVHAGSMDLTGEVLGDAKLYCNDEIVINGLVVGETIFTGRQARLGPSARFEKNVSYWLEGGELDFGRVPVGGQVSYDPKLKRSESRYSPRTWERHVRTGMGGLFIGTLLSGMAVIALSILLLKGAFRRAGESLQRSYLKSTGIGVVVFMVLPVAGIFAMITIIGIPLGLLLLAVFVFSVIFARIIAAMTLAAWLERRRAAKWSTGRLLLVSLGLYAAIKLVSVIPLVGWLAAFLVVLAGYGAFVLGLWRTRTAS